MDFLKASLSGAVLIILILLIRAFFLHKIPKKAIVVFWCLALCRLLIPFSIPLPVPAYVTTLTDQIRHAILYGVLWIGAMETAVIPVSPMVSVAVTVTAGESGVVESTQGVTPLMFCGMIWIAVSIALLLFFIINHSKWCRKYREALPVHNHFIMEWLAANDPSGRIQIRQSDRIVTPMAYGLWRPVILLPKWMETGNRSQLSYVLTHEMVHIRHFDLWKKWAMLATVCFHWFNPLVWMMFLFFNRDMELDCDQCVVGIHGPEAKAEYAYALIGMEEERMNFSPLFACFSRNIFEQRIKSIMKYRKYSAVSVVFSIILVVMIGALFGFETQAREMIADQKPDPLIITQTEEETVFSTYAYIDDVLFEFICSSEPGEADIDMEESIQQLQEMCDAYTNLGLYQDEKTNLFSFENHPIRSFLDANSRICIGQTEMPGAVDVYAVYQDEVLTGLRIATAEEYAASEY